MSDIPEDPRPERQKREERRHAHRSQLIAAGVLILVLAICAGLWLAGIFVMQARGGN